MYFWGDKWIMNCWIEKNRRQLKILAKLLINNVVECMNAWHNDDYKQMCIDDQIQNSHIWWSRWFRFRLIHLDNTTQSKSMWRGSLKICLDNKSNDIKILFFLVFFVRFEENPDKCKTVSLHYDVRSFRAQIFPILWILSSLFRFQ